MTAANEVSTVLLNSLIIDGKGTDKYCHLKQEVDNDAKTGDKAEVLQCGYICQETNEECETLTECSCENRGTNLFHRKAKSLIDGGDIFWNLSFSASNQEHIVNTNG